MPFFPSLPDDAGVRKIWETFNPEAHDGLTKFVRSFMNKESMLTRTEKEIIAAFVSELNQSDYCFIGHSRAAVKFGADRAVFEPLLTDIGAAPVREEMKPLLRFIKKLTLTPARVTQEDVDTVFAAGWDEQSIHQAICVCARFSMMNRLTLGHGLIANEDNADARAANLAAD
jgi:uncharacterized peroxidase-related enzyme